MEKEQYRAVIRAQKEAKKPAKKLIHLIINYRSHTYVRYPYKFIEIARHIKTGSKLFDCDGLWYFFQLEGDRWRQPNFSTRRIIRNGCMEIESDLHF
jgi:hypothetical protein